MTRQPRKGSRSTDKPKDDPLYKGYFSDRSNLHKESVLDNIDNYSSNGIGKIESNKTKNYESVDNTLSHDSSTSRISRPLYKERLTRIFATAVIVASAAAAAVMLSDKAFLTQLSQPNTATNSRGAYLIQR